MWVWSKSANNGIIKDKKYKLIKELSVGDNYWYYIIDELKRETYYSKKSFYSKSEIRDIKISTLLN
jgi:hypothetical protein